MTKQQKPILHGRDHARGGADPIPGMCSCKVNPFPAAVFELAETQDLRGYWRLGYSGGAGYPDTSGHPGGPCPAAVVHIDVALEEISGGILAADDDGAVQFNAFEESDYLRAADVSVPDQRFDFGSGDESMTVAAWVSPLDGTTPDPTTVVGQYLHSPIPDAGCGWRLGLNYPTLTPFFERTSQSLSPSVVAGGPPLGLETWAFLAGTYDHATGHNRLYVDGALTTQVVNAFSGLPTFGMGVHFAVGTTPGDTLNNYKGGLDEVTVWGGALSAESIATLYMAGVGVDSTATWYRPPTPLPLIPASPTAQDVADVLVALRLAIQE